MYVNINLSLINAFAGTEVFIDDYDTKLMFKDYGINAFVSLFYQNSRDIAVCHECTEDDCLHCKRKHVEHLILQTYIRYIDDIVDVIENETGVARSIILYACHLTDVEVED